MHSQYHHIRPLIYGVKGKELSDEEISFFEDVQPWGFILFDRNIDTSLQIKNLTQQLCDVMQREFLPILIDQEGGRVARIKPPLMREYPAAKCYGDLYDKDREQAQIATYIGAYLIAKDLMKLGINVNCMPCLDISTQITSEIIADRSYGDCVEKVSQLGLAAAQGLMKAGCLPVIKHIPGHGRGAVDSHIELPYVKDSIDELSKMDFVPFRTCQNLPLAMTGHLLFETIDVEEVSTCSKKVVKEIRQNIGFEGVLMSDDISMQALQGSVDISANKALEAGCDIILHCNADMKEMKKLAEKIDTVNETTLNRLHKLHKIQKNINQEHYKKSSEEDKKMLQDWNDIMQEHNTIS